MLQPRKLPLPANGRKFFRRFHLLGIAITAILIAGHAGAEIIEAETSPASGMVKAEETASGGKYVAGKDWNPLYRSDIPAEGDSFTVWARFRGTRVCLKAVDETGKQTELKWIYKSPESWTWESFGTFSKAQLGKVLLIIRSPGDDLTAGLDAVALAVNPHFDPNDPNKVLAPVVPGAQGEMVAETAVVKDAAEQEDKEEPSAIAPGIVMLKAGVSQMFTVRFPGAGSNDLQWSALDAKFQQNAEAGKVSEDGLYTAPNASGAYYVRAVSKSNPQLSAMASVIVATTESRELFTDNFDADTAIALVDENKNGVADYLESTDQKKASKPSPKKANGGSGLQDKQALIAAAGPGGGITRVDVVSGMATLFPGGFESNCLLVDDEANWGMGFGVRYGDPSIQGTMSFKFYDAGATGNGLYVEMSDSGVEGNEARTSAGSIISLLLKNGALEFGGKKTTYETQKVHTVKITFDELNPAASPNGTFTVELDGTVAGQAAFAKSAAPDRLSFHTAIASNMTKGLFFIDDLVVAGLQAPVASSVATSTVQTNVDWTKTVGKTGRNNYSLNAFMGFNPKDANDPKYQEGIKTMNPGLLRFHSWRMIDDGAKKPDAWVNFDGPTWKADRIKETMDGWSSFYKGDILMNIPGWPTGFKMLSNQALDPSEYDRYAEFCANLVKIINVDQKRGVKYWEITNERDEVYWVGPKKKGEPDNVAGLVTIYNKCAEAMKKVDSTIKTGGPAVAKGDEFGKFREFIQGTKQNLDFFSYHAYVSGSTGDSDKRVYDKASLATSFGREIRKILDQESPDRHIECHFNEYNISWTWRTNETRMRDNKGAVFDALVLVGVPGSGIDASNAWNEKDGVYGKMDPTNSLRPSAHVFELFNNHCVGDVVESTSSNKQRIVSFAVKNDREYTLVLINRSSKIQPTQVNIGDWKPSVVARAQVAKDGFSETKPDSAALAADGLFLPDNSVTVLTFSK